MFRRIASDPTISSSADWATRYLEQIYPVWGFPEIFISDMDSKLMSDFWAALCKALHYEVKWMGYDGTTWEPHDALMQDVPKLVKEYRR